MEETVSRRNTTRNNQENDLLFLTDISRSGTKATLKSCHISEQIDDSSDGADCEVDLTDTGTERRQIEPEKIPHELYLRECTRLHVIPVGVYLRLQGQTTLAIRHYNIGPNGAKALSVPLMLDSVLTHLDLEGNAIGYEGTRSLVETLTENVYISNLNLANNNLLSDGGKLVCDLLLSSNMIERINLSGNGFQDADADTFARVMKETRTLKELNLSHNEFGDFAGTEFGTAIAANESLEELDLSWNHLRRKSAAAFALGLKENVRLKRLNVSFNGFGTEGAAVIAMALNSNRMLVELDMRHNRLTDGDVHFIAGQLPSNDTLQILRIGENPVTTMGAQQLLEAIQISESSAIEELDMGGISVDRTFMKTLEDVKSSRKLSVFHGKVQKLPVEQPPESMSLKDENQMNEIGTKQSINKIIAVKEDIKNELNDSKQNLDIQNEKQKKNKDADTQPDIGKTQNEQNNKEQVTLGVTQDSENNPIDMRPIDGEAVSDSDKIDATENKEQAQETKEVPDDQVENVVEEESDEANIVAEEINNTPNELNVNNEQETACQTNETVKTSEPDVEQT